MELREYDSLKEFLMRNMFFDKEHSFVIHFLRNGEFIETHEHSVNEWIIFDNGGVCEVQIEKEKQKLYPRLLKTTSVLILKNKKHSFRALSDICYFVLRDAESVKS